MSNTAQVEPTEDHRRAAVMHHYKYAVLPDKGYLTDWVRTGDATNREDVFAVVIALARLLAEREAKLQARIDDLTEELAATDTTEMRLRSEVDTLGARIAELEAQLKATGATE